MTRSRLTAAGIALVVNLLVLYWPKTTDAGAGVPHLDKVVHVASFAALAWSCLRAQLPVRWVLPLLGVHAVLSEVVQHVALPRRSGDPADAIADVTGVLVGTVLARASWTRDREEQG